ncbi:helix-turn-helix domain-containing protein [Dyadobacter chenwenxiniae]|uniref:Helix-turn-helix domain-containing protein n=1 Tax=Dyadobacter chenwenxiniae TaxID=2906456 RepID=A0A9X1TD33_9BACT|nr:helix-turn-helix domain-containing protein [Dyadobacter chenwenxiniae]MCF0059875.1 helix-turn-helix domain-containing protein [Dyadobacter chenwenxiniae]UON85615.1 helix-turn-helix domain-containing protein [Dyadobacter chenwenxiniae]
MEEEGIKGRFSEEIQELGVSKNAIASQIGFSSQTFTNVTSGRNMPGALLLSRIHKFYPTFDISYVITGIRSNDDSEEVKKLKEDLDLQRAIVRKFAMPGKSKGATIICPGNRTRDTRRKMFKDMKAATIVPVPGRVPNAIINPNWFTGLIGLN